MRRGRSTQKRVQIDPLLFVANPLGPGLAPMQKENWHMNEGFGLKKVLRAGYDETLGRLPWP